MHARQLSWTIPTFEVILSQSLTLSSSSNLNELRYEMRSLVFVQRLRIYASLVRYMLSLLSSNSLKLISLSIGTRASLVVVKLFSKPKSLYPKVTITLPFWKLPDPKSFCLRAPFNGHKNRSIRNLYRNNNRPRLDLRPVRKKCFLGEKRLRMKGDSLITENGTHQVS